MDAETQATPVAAPKSALERNIDLSVAIADLEKKVDERLKRIGRNAKMPGFRPGKVPTKILQQQYGPEARHEAINELIDAAFRTATNAQELRVAGYPRVEPKPTESKTHVEFTAKFEVYPEIALADLSKTRVERPQLEVGEAEIERTIEILRKQRVVFQEIERAAQQEDRVTIDFVGKKDGEPFAGGSASDYAFVLGQKSMLPEFEQAVEGMQSGETKSFEITFPADYFAKDMAGQTVQFEVSLKKVEAPHLPEIDAAFATSLGIVDGDTDKLLAEITENLQREVKRRIDSRIKDQVMEALLSANPIEIPAALLQMEIENLAQQAMQDMQNRGMQTKDVNMQREWFVEKARRRVSLGLIVSELVEKHSLRATPAQVKAMVTELAASYENPAEVIKQHYADAESLRQMEALVLENNVVEWVLTQAKVEDKAIAFEELMGREAQS